MFAVQGECRSASAHAVARKVLATLVHLDLQGEMEMGVRLGQKAAAASVAPDADRLGVSGCPELYRGRGHDCPLASGNARESLVWLQLSRMPRPLAAHLAVESPAGAEHRDAGELLKGVGFAARLSSGRQGCWAAGAGRK